MAKKLFVGNLSFQVDEASLKEHFGSIGEVLSVNIITDSATGRSRGFGFVEMTSEGDAERAIKELNGSDFMGRPLNVSEAREQRPRTGGGRGDRRGGFSRGQRKSGWR